MMVLFAKFVEQKQEGTATMEDMSANHVELSLEGKEFNNLNQSNLPEKIRIINLFMGTITDLG